MPSISIQVSIGDSAAQVDELTRALTGLTAAAKGSQAAAKAAEAKKKAESGS